MVTSSIVDKKSGHDIDLSGIRVLNPNSSLYSTQLQCMYLTANQSATHEAPKAKAPRQESKLWLLGYADALDSWEKEHDKCSQILSTSTKWEGYSIV